MGSDPVAASAAPTDFVHDPRLAKAITYLSNQQLVETKTKNAEGVRNLQPRVARVSALPWVTRKIFVATLKGLLRRVRHALQYSRTLLRNSCVKTMRVNKLRNGVSVDSACQKFLLVDDAGRPRWGLSEFICS